MKGNCTALSIALGLVSALTVCAQENPEVAPRAIPVNTGPNEVARFLAGMPVSENSSLAPLTRDPKWEAHAAFFEEQFFVVTELALPADNLGSHFHGPPIFSHGSRFDGISYGEICELATAGVVV